MKYKFILFSPWLLKSPVALDARGRLGFHGSLRVRFFTKPVNPKLGPLMRTTGSFEEHPQGHVSESDGRGISKPTSYSDHEFKDDPVLFRDRAHETLTQRNFTLAAVRTEALSGY